jgi:hydroxypyruvate isomerase
MPRFCANLSFLYTELPFLDRFAAAARDGFIGVEYFFPYGHAPQDIAQRLADNGLVQVLFNAPVAGPGSAVNQAAWDAGARGLACVPGREAEFQTTVHMALDYAQALQCTQVHVLAGVVPSAHASDLAAVHATYRSNLRWACAQAAVHGVQLLIEPINTRDMPGYYLTRQDQAHAILAEVGSANLQVQMDLYHCQIMEGDVTTRLRNYVPTGRVGHVQIASVPMRQEPDEGELNYSYVLGELDRLGYRGWVGCEYKPRLGAHNGATHAGLTWMQAYSKPA